MDAKQSRRKFLKTATIGAGAAALSSCQTGSSPKRPKKLKGNINQVVAGWCFMNASPKKWTAEQLIANCAELGIDGVELFDVKHWHLLKKHKMVCAATKSHTFVRGMNNKGHHPECFEALEKAIKDTGAAGFPNVMTFTGFADTSSHKNGSKVSLEEGKKNCIEGYKKMALIAEKHKVSMVIEPLNSKVDEKMKGHPGYQGSHIDYCAEIVRAVGSPGLTLLFDVYHVQIMDGDLNRRIEKHKNIIGHVQIAGNPGRGEIGDDQEINYSGVMKAFLKAGYKGYVGHEWIPTRDPMAGLREAVAICDV
jgi:hydroxypyruvate isomerase